MTPDEINAIELRLAERVRQHEERRKLIALNPLLDSLIIGMQSDTRALLLELRAMRAARASDR